MLTDNSTISKRQWLLAAGLLGCLCIVNPRATLAQRNRGTADRFQAQHDDYVAAFQKSLSQLIAECESKNLTNAVAELKPWQAAVNVSALSDRVLPENVQPDIPLSLPQDERLWRIEFRTLRQEVSQQLYLLSRRAINAGMPHAAWRLIHEVLWYDSDWERARTLLGYEQYGDQWVTPFAARKLRDRFVWHDQFGWLPATHVDRYEKGERFFRNRWYTAQKEAELRREWVHAWEIETDNYLLKTNVGLEEGVALARKLEVFHDWFQRAFPAFFNTPAQLKVLFGSSTGRRSSKRSHYVVHYYRSKDEYVRRLIAKNPQIAISNGIYSPDEHISHFFVDPNSDIESTVYHEATHQILYELDPKPRRIADNEHFWIVEGFACYIESFRPLENGVSIGNPDYVRFYFAKQNLVKDGFFVPLDRFASLSKNAYQDPHQISQRYSQASGVVHFYMHFESGRYRDALIDHFAALYRPIAPGFRIGGMDQFTGVDYSVLSRQYRDYISGLDSNPNRLAAAIQAAAAKEAAQQPLP
ncbi:MAG: DUF1570 domain-containing protein [Rhodopirellula sp.]|nr:DUF1570 domain-containing protein [Rhodopirellula sp.]